MLTLAPADTIAGIAGTATAITYTFTGMELASGVEAYKVLAQGQLNNTVGTLYTAASGTQVFIKNITLVNATGSDVSGIKLYQNGTVAGKQITGSMTIPANGWATWEEDGWRVYNSTGELLEKISNLSTGGGSGGGSLMQSWPVTFSTTTTDADPGTGVFRWNFSTLSGHPDLIMYLDLLDSNGVDKTSIIDALPLSDARKVTLVRLYQNATSQEFVVAKLMTRTTATGYRKLGFQILHLRDVAAANATAYTIQFESYGAGFPMLTMSKQNIGNDARIIGLPGFIPNKIKSKPLTSARAQVVFFELEAPILLRAITAILTSAASTGGDRRVMIYNITDQRVDGPQGGSLQYDSGLQAGAWAVGIGARTITPSVPVMLPAGQYMLIDAVGVFTGTLTATALNGAFHHSASIKVVSGAWTTLTDMYFPSDLTGTPADPFGSMAALTMVQSNLATTNGGDQFDLVTALNWNPGF